MVVAVCWCRQLPRKIGALKEARSLLQSVCPTDMSGAEVEADVAGEDHQLALGI